MVNINRASPIGAITALFACVASLIGGLVPLEAQTSAHHLGSNLDAVNDYSPQLPFIDLFKISRPWFTQCDPEAGDPGCSYQNSWDTGEANLLNTDSSGWVRSLPSPGAAPVFTMAATFWDLAQGFPAGRYIVLYDGAGTIEYGIAGEKVSAESRAGRDVVIVTPSRGGLLLRISATDPQGTGNYIRNIRVVREAHEGLLATQTFSPLFLQRIRPYKTLRFMDWMRTNDSSAGTWGSRPLEGDARYTGEQGVPLEVMIELANRSAKRPWFNIPHQANDAYITNFAAAVKAGLRADLPLFVEYSNEIWNSGFSQGDWVQQRGEATWPSSGESGFTKRINYHGKRTAEVCDMFRQQFGSQASRVVCVMASQAANSWTATEALECPLWDEAPCVGHGIGAIAIAPYFGDYVGQAENQAQVEAWTQESDGGLGSLFRELSQGGELSGGPTGGAIAQSFEWIEANRTVAESKGITLVAYEGGQHLVGIGAAGDSAALTELFTSANRDPRMRALYTRYLNGWHARGGGIFAHFSDISPYTRYGSWGALETANQSTSPKYNALLEYSGISVPPAATRFRLTVSKNRGGSVLTASGAITCGTRCSALFARNSVVTLFAKPSRGYRFVRWSGACTNRQPQCQIPMSSAKAVGALFRRRPQ